MARPSIPTPGLVPFHAELNAVLQDAQDSLDAHEARVTAAECTFASPGASRVVIYDDTGANPAAKRLAFTAVLSAPLMPVAGPVVISSPNGIVRSSY